MIFQMKHDTKLEFVTFPETGVLVKGHGSSWFLREPVMLPSSFVPLDISNIIPTGNNPPLIYLIQRQRINLAVDAPCTFKSRVLDCNIPE